MSFFKQLGSALSNPWLRGASAVAGLASAGGLFDNTSLSDIGVGDAGGKVGGLGLSTLAGGANLVTGGAAALTGRDTVGGLAQMGLGAYNVMQRNTLSDLGIGKAGSKLGDSGNFKSLAQSLGQDWSVKGNLLGATTAASGADTGQSKIIAPGAQANPAPSNMLRVTPDAATTQDAGEAFKNAGAGGPRVAAAPTAPKSPTLAGLGMDATSTLESTSAAAFTPQIPGTKGVDNFGQPMSKPDLMAQVGKGSPYPSGDMREAAGYSALGADFGKVTLADGRTVDTFQGRPMGVPTAPAVKVEPKAFFDKVLDNPSLVVGGGAVMAGFFMPDPAEKMMADYEKRLAQFTTNVDPASPAGQQYIAAYSERRKRDLADQYDKATQELDSSFAERGMTGSTLYNDARARLEQQYMNTASNIGQEATDAWLNFAKGQQAVVSSASQSAAMPNAISAAMNKPTDFKSMGTSLALAR